MANKQYLPKDHNGVMQQVGWLGASGRYYPLGTEQAEIRTNEPGSYSPVYEQIGVWEWNETRQEWTVHHD